MMNPSLEALKDHFRQLVGMRLPDYREEEGTVVASKTCDVTGELYTVQMPIEAYATWRSGVPAQIAFPDLSDDQREFLVNGQTPAEYERRIPSK